MSIYYVLDTDEYTGEKFDIGDIMSKVCDELYIKHKLKLCIYNGPTKEEIYSWAKCNNYTLLHEEILWKNMTLEEKCEKFFSYLEKINAISSDLIIIDAYFFPKHYDDDYVELITKILIRSDFKSLTIVVNKATFNKDVYEQIKNKLNKNFTVKYSDEFHDRIWIANKNKGFFVGTSMNGIGGKISSINISDETNDLEEVSSQIYELPSE